MKNICPLEGTFERPQVIQPGSDAATNLANRFHTGPLGSYTTVKGVPVEQVYVDMFASIRSDVKQHSDLILSLLAHIDGQ